MSELPPTAPSPAFLSAFRRRAGACGRMSFAAFMELALYDPEIGYYHRPERRVGYGGGTDFYTASTSGPIFGELVAAACVTLLAGCDPRDFTFVEIGAEPAAPGATAGGVLAGAVHPFGQARTVALGEEPALAGRCVVFANELFDAQPFERFVARNGHWRQLGVAEHDGRLIEVELQQTANALLPPAAPEGQVFDAPLAAAALLEKLATPAWSGLFVTCDYGRSLRELVAEHPAGTARAYHRHTQSNRLLDRPGGQDLTCHVCWDWLVDALQRHGFVSPVVETQEAFFVRHAGDYLAAATAREAAAFSRKKLSLLQLLHPAHLGQKFQVLHATRGVSPGGLKGAR